MIKSDVLKDYDKDYDKIEKAKCAIEDLSNKVEPKKSDLQALLFIKNKYNDFFLIK